MREGSEEACWSFYPFASELILAHFTLSASWATLQTCLHLTMYLTHPDQTDFPPALQPCPIISTIMLMISSTGCPVAAGAVGQALADMTCPTWPALTALLGAGLCCSWTNPAIQICNFQGKKSVCLTLSISTTITCQHHHILVHALTLNSV